MPPKAWTGCTNMSLEEAEELSIAFISLVADLDKISHQAPPSELINNLRDGLLQAQDLAKKIQVFADLRDTGLSVAGIAGILSLEQQLPQCATYDNDFKELKATLASQLTLLQKLRNPVHSLLEVSVALRDEKNKRMEIEGELLGKDSKRGSTVVRDSATIGKLQNQLGRANEENQHSKARITELEGDLELLHKKVERIHLAKKTLVTSVGLSLGSRSFQREDDVQGERVEWLESQIQSLKETIHSNNEFIAKLERCKKEDYPIRDEEAHFGLEDRQENRVLENSFPNSAGHKFPSRKIDNTLQNESLDLRSQAEADTQLQQTIKKLEQEERKHVLEIQHLNYYVINLRKDVSKYRQEASEIFAQKIAVEQEIRHIKRQFERIAGSMTATIDRWRDTPRTKFGPDI